MPGFRVYRYGCICLALIIWLPVGLLAGIGLTLYGVALYAKELMAATMSGRQSNQDIEKEAIRLTLVYLTGFRNIFSIA